MEEWRKVNGYDNYYVSSEGRIYNVVTEKFIGNKNSDKYKYKRVKLSENGKKVFIDVHRLVADTFIPNPNNCEVVNHINGITTDNRVENLEWCSRSENQKHAYRIGLETAMKGEQNKNAKLNEIAVKQIRETYKRGDRQRGAEALARKYGVSGTAIKMCLRGVSWSHV